MIISVAFDVKNHVSVMESWPIKNGDKTLYFERDGNILKKVIVAFKDVGLEHAPVLTSRSDSESIPTFNVGGGQYITLARTILMSWQAVASGIQVVDLDFDSYEIKFKAESISEEPLIQMTSIKTGYDPIEQPCGFEQFGRAFCVGVVDDGRVESTAHFRDGRIAFSAGRYVDSYTSMFLFLETRYCDGKTGRDQQIDLLKRQRAVCDAIEKNCKFFNDMKDSRNRRFDLFDDAQTVDQKIRILVLLRGKLRHHSLKSPHRWNPNEQGNYETAARFLSSVVGDIVSAESLADIYSPAALEDFRKQSIESGFETRINLATYRVSAGPALELSMSYPTTRVTSLLCLNIVREAVKQCSKAAQLEDTVKLEAKHERSKLEAFTLELGVWAYTSSKEITPNASVFSIRCQFEHSQHEHIKVDEFIVPYRNRTIGIMNAWDLMSLCIDHIEDRDPRTRIVSLKLFVGENRRAILSYRVGALVRI